MPTDCSVLRTPTILPYIRIFLCSYRGGFQGLSPTYEQAHVGLDLLTLASLYNIILQIVEYYKSDRQINR